MYMVMLMILILLDESNLNEKLVIMYCVKVDKLMKFCPNIRMILLCVLPMSLLLIVDIEEHKNEK